MLEWGECGEVRDPDSSTLLWRGLLAKVGIAYGVPASKAPLNTGGCASRFWWVAEADCGVAGVLPGLQGRMPALPAGQPAIQPCRPSCRQACLSACLPVPICLLYPCHAGRADYFGSVPNLAARLMSVAQPGQVLVDGRLGGMRGLQWRDEASALLLSPQLGAIELTQLGYLQVKVGG